MRVQHNQAYSHYPPPLKGLNYIVHTGVKKREGNYGHMVFDSFDNVAHVWLSLNFCDGLLC